MFFKKYVRFLFLTICIFSFFGFRVGVTLTETSSSLIEDSNEMIPHAASAESSHQILPLSLLVYTQYVDSNPGGELEHTMAAINETYGTDYYSTKITDSAQLNTMLPGQDQLTIQ